MGQPSAALPTAQRPHRPGYHGFPWVRLRKSVQYAALAAFIALFIWSRQGGWPGNLVNIPLRLDPLLVLSHAIAARTLLAGSALALIVIVLTLVAGRAWCGWLCPLGTVLDLVHLHKTKSARSKPAESWRTVKYVLLIATLTAALFANLSLLFLDPLTILLRTLTVSIWPALDRVVSAAELLLYKVPALEDPLSSFDAWLRPAVLPPTPAHFRDAALFALLFAALLGLDLLASRFWCRYLCPLGGLLGLLSKVAVFRRHLKQECKGCVLCTERCPTGTIDPAKGYASDPGECTMCMDCLEVCPRDLTTFSPQLSFASWNAYNPNRRQALFTMGAAAAVVALYQSTKPAAPRSTAPIRPPGVASTNPDLVAFTQCTRCSECMRVCPTTGLQPAVLDADLAALGSPVLIPRLGYCDYSCNACGQVCPVQAIPPLTLEQKRLAVIGRAYIEEDRCLAWSDHTPCIVCEEMCPVPEKAIVLEKADLPDYRGGIVSLQLPHVVRERCIGCGICEYQCPVQGNAAIRITGVSAPV